MAGSGKKTGSKMGFFMLVLEVLEPFRMVLSGFQWVEGEPRAGAAEQLRGGVAAGDPAAG